ncbi:hypothetical protein ABC255_21165 [Neobacillus sp. 3P2-tot-E-2]|uniref:hypothetical protein n=1 Tax=Neobacillus sp. 3P2-tot-E-2 TaxID=3132212 RepID=UPI0039A28E0A
MIKLWKLLLIQMVKEFHLTYWCPQEILRIVPNKKELDADGQTLVHAVIEVIDEFGRLVPTAELKTYARV